IQSSAPRAIQSSAPRAVNVGVLIWI
ncbi:MAG: hypothetical protein QOC73_2064, partial [Actinomycetota bacterium]|nr:hypothetical protein [Actinomycetota bacterium]